MTTFPTVSLTAFTKEGEPLGSGSFGTVYKGTYESKIIAVKEIKPRDDSNVYQLFKSFEKEVVVMAQAQHNNIVKFYAACLEGEKLILLMEYAGKGTLFNILHSAAQISWSLGLRWAADMGKGLVYLHRELNVVHCDLKSSNILIADDDTAKISDFGLSKIKSEGFLQPPTSLQERGTIQWTAPELLKPHAKASFASDIYSLGVVLWEIVSRHPPFAGHLPILVEVWIAQNVQEAIPSTCPEGYAALIQDCWNLDPQKRPPASTIANCLNFFQISPTAIDKSSLIVAAPLPSLFSPTSSETKPKPSVPVLVPQEPPPTALDPLLPDTDYLNKYAELDLPMTNQKFPIRDLFTQLVITEQKSEQTSPFRQNSELPERDSLLEAFNRLHTTQASVALEQLFTNGKKHLKKVLLLGRAGIGKSTLCQKIVYDWGTKNLWNDRYTAVYWIPLRACTKVTVSEGDHQAERWLAKAIATLIFKKSSLVEKVEQQIKNYSEKTLILLDGFDEANADAAQIVKDLLEETHLTFLITSRPGVTATLISQMDRVVENMGFSDEHLENYVERFFQKDNSPVVPSHLAKKQKVSHPSQVEKNTFLGKKEAFLKKIKTNPNLFALAHVPLQLQMFCALWERVNGQEGFPSTLTPLYHRIVNDMIMWQYNKEGKNPQDIKPAEKNKQLTCLGQIAYRGLKEGRLLIPQELVEKVCGEPEFNLTGKELLTTGLIKAAGEEINPAYYFLHLTFQEYLIAWTMSREKNVEEIYRFVTEHKNLPQFQLVLSFLAGILSSEESLDILKTFFSRLQEPGEFKGHVRIELLCCCLNEVSSKELHQWVEETYHLQEFIILGVLQNEVIRLKDKSALDWVIRLFERAPLAFSDIKKPLLKMLETSSCNNRIEISSRLGFTTLFADYLQSFIDSLLKEMGNPDEDVRTSAAEAIANISYKLEPKMLKRLMDSLLKAIRNLNEDIRFSACDVIDKMSERLEPELLKPLIDPLLTAMNDPNEDMCSSAIDAIGNIHKSLEPEQLEQLIDPLIEAISDPDEDIRYFAIHTIGTISYNLEPEQLERLIDPLIEAMNDLHKGVCSFASEAIGTISEKLDFEQLESLIKRLLEAMQDPNKRIYSSAINAIEKVSKNLEPEQLEQLIDPLFSAMDHSASDVYSSAARAIGAISEKLELEQLKSLIKRLLEAMNDPNKRIYSSAIQAIGIVSTNLEPEQFEQLIGPLLSAMNDPKDGIRSAAAHALWYISTYGKKQQFERLIDPLLKVMSDSNEHIRSSAIASIEKISEKLKLGQLEQLVNPLLKAMSDSNEHIRSSATKVIKNISKELGPNQLKQLIDPLLKATNDLSEGIRSSAAECLRNISPWKYWSCITPNQEGNKITLLLAQHALIRKTNLFIEVKENQIYLCIIEDKKKHKHSITKEQVEIIKKSIPI